MPTINPASKTQPTPHIFMPTEDQLKAAYKSEIDAADKAGKLHFSMHAPVKNADKYPHYVLNHGVDTAQVAYVIKGSLYVRNEVDGGIMNSWAKVGPVPMF
jgi:hypothetical protein